MSTTGEESAATLAGTLAGNTHTEHPEPPKRRRRMKASVIAFILVIAGLYFVPPFASYGLQDWVPCRPLGPGFAGGGITHGFPNYAYTRYPVNEDLNSRDRPYTPESELRARLGMSEACEQARTNQQTTLNIVLAGGLASLTGFIGHRILRRLDSLA